MVTEWFCYLVTRSVRRTGFEPETLAFFLTTLGTAVCATATPEDMFKQTVFIILGVALYFFLGAWLRSLERVKASRFLAAAAALGLLAVNVVFSEAVFGARNWLEIAGRQLPALGARQGALHLHRRSDARQALREAEPLCVHRLFRRLRHRPRAHRRLRHGGHLLCDLPRHLLHALGQLCDGVPRGLGRGDGGLPGALRETLYSRALREPGATSGRTSGTRATSRPTR